MNRDLQARTPHLILGGARSGKSSHAERLVTSLPPPYVYVATARILDGEMADRVRRHQDRRSSNWETIECPLDLTGALKRLQGRGRPVLVDCITLWLSNLLLDASAGQPEARLSGLCKFIPAADYPLFLVSNEVGWGIVPDNPLARRFRDLSGLANQRIASVSSAVTLVAAGIPITLK